MYLRSHVIYDFLLKLCLGIVLNEDLITGTNQTKKRCPLIQRTENVVTPPKKIAGNVQRLYDRRNDLCKPATLPAILVSKEDSYIRL